MTWRDSDLSPGRLSDRMVRPADRRGKSHSSPWAQPTQTGGPRDRNTQPYDEVYQFADSGRAVRDSRNIQPQVAGQ